MHSEFKLKLNSYMNKVNHLMNQGYTYCGGGYQKKLKVGITQVFTEDYIQNVKVKELVAAVRSVEPKTEVKSDFNLYIQPYNFED